MLGEGLELERVKGIFTTSHILHGVLSPAALTAEKQRICIIYIIGKCITFLAFSTGVITS